MGKPNNVVSVRPHIGDGGGFGGGGGFFGGFGGFGGGGGGGVGGGGERSQSPDRWRHRGIQIKDVIEQGCEQAQTSNKLHFVSKFKTWWKRLAKKRVHMNFDVQDLVIQHILVESHITDIKICVLVNSLWRQRCLPKLFSVIRLRNMDKMAQFLSLMHHNSSPSIRQIDQTSPVVRFVRVLILDFSINAEPEVDWALSFIQQVKRGVLSLTTLSIHQDQPRSTRKYLSPHANDIQRLQKSLSRSFGGLQKLRIDACRFGAFTDLLRILLAVPQLVQLECNDVHWDGQNILPSSYRLHPTLRWVRVKHCTSNWLLFALWTKDSSQVIGARSIFPGIALEESIFLQRLGRCSHALSEGDTMEFRRENVQKSGRWALRIVDEDNLLTMQINILPYTDDLVTSGGIETIIFVDESAEKLRIAYDWPKIAKLFENSRQDLSSLSSIVLDLRVEDTRNEQKVVEAFPDLVRKMLRLETLAWSEGVPVEYRDRH